MISGAELLMRYVLLWMICLALGQGAIAAGRSKSCNRERKVFTQPQGQISDGQGNYQNNSHCEWLIKAPADKRSFITLYFTSLHTECAFDHIFIHDGDSYSAPLLASISGRNEHPPVFTARSGAMLILFYSDTNYVLDGFHANYSIDPCPRDCSGRGDCLGGDCLCNVGFLGEACEFEECPNNCTSSLSHSQGKCTIDGCVCLPEFSGRSCSLSSVSDRQHVGWHLLATEQEGFFHPRSGHAVAYLPFTDHLYTFGGRNFSTVFGDFLVYDFGTSKWTPLTSKIMPAARWGHSMVHHADSILMFGGELADGSLSNELWVYNVQKQEWNLEEADSSSLVEPPHVAFHSLTMIEQKTFIVFGGRIEGGEFSNKIFKLNLLMGKPKWELIEPSAGNPIRVVGHSATFHAESRSILVYGGIVADMARFSKLSASLYAFNVEKKHWTQLHYPASGSGRFQTTSQRSSQSQRPDHPIERAFHTATIAGNYLVIFGGYMHRHSMEEKCYDDQIYLYHLKCYKWVSYDVLTSNSNGLPKDRRMPYNSGVYSHGMALRRGGTLLILGGYSGYMRGDVRALQLPETVTHITSETASVLCGHHNYSETACKENPACGWCTSLSMCMDRNKKADCGAPFSVGTCPSLCLALHDCQSCMAWGEGQEITNHVMVDAGGFMPRSCGWCVSSSQCHSLNDPPLLCRTSENKTIEGQSEGYWGNHGYVVTNLPECRSHNYKPGLTYIQYHNPVNFTLPDEVYMVNASAARVVVPNRKNETNAGLARLLGYLHPTGVTVDSAGSPRIFVRSGFASELELSTDDKEANLELVAKQGVSSFNITEAVRPSLEKLIPIVGKGARYLLRMDVHLTCDRAHKGTCENTSEIRWCPQQRPCYQFGLIPIKYLEPYKNGTDCRRKPTCLACLVDSACGWCASKQICVARSGDEDECTAVKDGELLVLEPEQCTNCNYHIYCKSCLADENCEWVAEEIACKRRGRNSLALREPSECPTPCHLRQGCANCLGERGRCAWCHQTQQCFLFSTYISSFMYGGCREWVDEDIAPLLHKGLTRGGPIQCPDCSRHADCKSCLSQLGCGWCGNVDNPNNGLCSAGDFSGPYNSTCNDIVADANEVIVGPADWSYAKCPNVDECRLQLAQCHYNATCRDTEDSYICVCNKGFKGDGKNECVKTCHEDCNHGTCSEAPDYKCICETGWTGEFCDIDCGCNFHSTCLSGIGKCDKCMHNTSGPRCDRCIKGAFGDATRREGCSLCKCNGHGDPEKSFCDSVSGVCFCIHNTESKYCDRCMPGYYGNPARNGTCYKDCTDHKQFLSEQFGAFGSREGSSLIPQHCLWILQGQQHSTIQLTISPKLNIRCPENHVYVYEGLFSANSQGQLLGAFCNTHRNQPIVLTSKTNQLSIYYRRTKLDEGFNATYKQLWCPSGCSDKYRKCQDGLCVCEPGRGGASCQKVLCPKGCSANNGNCEQAYSVCRCNENYGGEACDVELNPVRRIVWTLLYDVERVFSSDTISLTDLVVDSPPDIQFGHSLLVTESHMWLFGGVSQMDQDSNRLYIYDKDFYQWKKVNVSHDESKMPSPRRHHCATMVGKDMYVYGGMNRQFSALGDFWKFATVHRTWTTIATGPDVPPLVGCSLTNVRNSFLVMIGGYSPENGFQEKTLIYTIQDTTFKVFNTTGASPEGIFGHTAEYHLPTECIYVFGGILYEAAGAQTSSVLFALHVGTRVWTRLPPDERAKPLSNIAARFFHSSTLVGDTMFIVGGKDSLGEASPDAFMYDITCNSWNRLQGDDIRASGTPPLHFSSAKAVTLNNEIYVYGGFTNIPQGFFYKVSIPSDICYLYKNRVNCLDNLGCSFCKVDSDTEKSHICLRTTEIPLNANCTPLINKCTGDWIHKRNCESFENCVDCVAQWPGAKGNLQEPVCQWCTDCLKGKCVAVGNDCGVQTTPDCNLGKEQSLVRSPEQCPQRSCVASECEKCRDLGKCMWTRQVYRSGELKYDVSQTPRFDWTCVRKTIKDQVNHPVESNPPRSCPRRCGSYTNCTTCLESTGGEGGWHECWWASSLGQCISPSFATIRCEGGMCGPILQGNPHMCSLPCHSHSQSKICLSDPHCGWCALINANGQGLCMEGNKKGPTGGSCQNGTVFLNGHPLPGDVSKWLQSHGTHVGWYYFRRPEENECLNGHHDCDPDKEKCVDKDDGFECVCQEGYSFDNITAECRPECTQGCEHGRCVRPDLCKCDFGYVGNNCSVACKCNGNSDCKDSDNLDVCIKCQNNTQGHQCSQCVTGFVGDPSKGERCMSCYNYCFRHATYCIDKDLMDSLDNSTKGDYEELVKIALTKPGPLETAVCLNCSDNTTDSRCETCKKGFFIRDGDITNGCRPCECHGHSDTCDEKTGELCQCRNNTEADKNCSLNSRTKQHSCWNLQCIKCKENFQGLPTNGHQCYRHMRLEQDYCLDPSNQGECNNPERVPLPSGKTVFFVVQPRYMNVNIRIIIDITAGEVDLHMASKEDVFVVTYNKTTGVHQVSVDSKYEVVREEVERAPLGNMTFATMKFLKPATAHHRRETPPQNSVHGDATVLAKYPNVNQIEVQGSTRPTLQIVKREARGLTTYVEIEKPHHFLLVNSLRNRLILTIPQSVYDLRTTKLYIVISGVADQSYGNLFFRQDQTRIDLFVFFSVFFSCFFLFLSWCVVIWKVKQGLDIRRARRLQAAEMQHMANRPFSKIYSTMYPIEDPDDFGFVELSPLATKTKRKGKSQVHLANTPKVVRAFESASPGGTYRPVSVEPTADGQAAVTTMLISLPGGSSAPVHLCIGSALTSIRGTFNSRC